MKKNGFTLIELLAVIVLISLLIGLGAAGITKISDNMKNKSFNTKVELIEQAGILWGQDNKALLQSDGKCLIKDGNISREYSCKKITIEELINDDYLESENYNEVEYTNPKDNTSILVNKVFVFKKNNRVTAYYPIDLYEIIDEPEIDGYIEKQAKLYGENNKTSFSNITIDGTPYSGVEITYQNLIAKGYLGETQVNLNLNDKIAIYLDGDKMEIQR